MAAAFVVLFTAHTPCAKVHGKSPEAGDAVVVENNPVITLLPKGLAG